MSGFVWTRDRVRAALGLPEEGGPAKGYAGISTDTRTLEPGELFVALPGARFDGAEFVSAAIERGAAGAIAQRQLDDVPDGFDFFLVDDAIEALGRLAGERRREIDPTVVAITGTSGKTTTRELTAGALGDGAYASPANFNNRVGLPLSILRAPADAGIWILELASNQPGEIAALGAVAEPDIAVITSVSEGHLEGLGDLQGVLAEKLSLLRSLRDGGVALVADEPPDLPRAAGEVWPDVRTVGLGPTADERPERWSMSERGVAWRWHDVDFELHGFGSHLIRNALFACCVAHLLGIEPEDAARRLGDVELPPMRGEVRRLDGLTLLIDCYNANPASFRAAIDGLDALAAGRRRAVLAGTMLELGGRSETLHRQVARWMIEADIELIAAIGEFREAFAKIDRDGLILESDLETAYRRLADELSGDEAVLIKASRGMKFERAVEMFQRDFGTDRGSSETRTRG
ncbi:MAG: UDP-N-acetylmuramoyl-tripeptide--D-alanyl-D-alanine ligase [Gemmatimonadetes bacterium]|uniref:UDP-N-acetylmuramoyl-tripeptide--D-alanyl-D-alanine ligase n=1 Tax=Candidatus Kutchimonas denitrificans TaxID=3056748 RepID=A0AAE4ZBM6_9BACT|nr:UDP-N-acetylmuramoyl-tripeptide--D-alanyl-D-alanine ligase [Gemmatimonadota bacterium]NIR74545.1 UDP-N-acetylmuramoyl-tripeptide--D-alanyl-D-alanine ligase [Candidatus Kutchimonas denitrificans]NIS02735.1 UDP-N-acetylmuramoyl-tripeptide--D-alanyl-D-alanine ligase [Gemmatimonadota bacterium]NIT68896.1 UDP-N-acetylmuramoyl-tripeptide--D-alanyl-D-alanine ligase [Gemmatimonadota bacterium]NIU52201.1 UDP-N-acetylmuramoyl-tripeptide--D-alanyl-D-alanine ligase [Gemmatimonadota bacterium]